MRTIDFSKWEVRKLSIKTKNATGFKVANCVGTLEDEYEIKRVVKKCRGVEKKVKQKPIAGTLNLSLHIPYDVYCEMFDMLRDDLKAGVQGYGMNNIHQEFCIVCEMYNEDDEMMLVAYPNCVSATGPITVIENGGEEIAETELEIALMPDENEYFRYECIPDELEDTNSTIATQWMTAFAPELVAKTATA